MTISNNRPTIFCTHTASLSGVKCVRMPPKLDDQCKTSKSKSQTKSYVIVKY